MQTKTLAKQTAVVVVGVMLAGYLMYAMRDIGFVRDAQRGYGG